MSESKTEPSLKGSGDLHESEALLKLNRNVRLTRILGALLLVVGWAYFALPNLGSPRFFLDTLVFAALGALAFVISYNLRHHAMSLEKKLRLRLIKRNMELESMATRDNLTHLFNRRHFFDRFERELGTARSLKRPLSLLLIEVVAMKQINDAHGHRAGDSFLAYVGRFLAEQSRASDVPARIGGDEFAVLLPDTAEDAARAATTRLLQALEKAAPFEQVGATIKLTASVGAAGYPWAADSIDAIMRLADESMRAQREHIAAVAAVDSALSSELGD